MQKLCPISYKMIDENVARINSLQIILLYLAFILTGSPLILAFIFADFFIRGFIDGTYSPVAYLSKALIQRVGIKPKTINAGPKIFAAQVGTFITGAVLFCAVTGFSTVGCYFAGVLMFFAFLESAFSYCVACKLYPLFRKLG